jgi:hypothetical protein
MRARPELRIGTATEAWIFRSGEPGAAEQGRAPRVADAEADQHGERSGWSPAFKGSMFEGDRDGGRNRIAAVRHGYAKSLSWDAHAFTQVIEHIAIRLMKNKQIDFLH